MPHGPPAIGGESVAVEIDDVDVHRTQRVSFFENPRSLIHQSVDATIHNFVSRDLPLRNACLSAPLSHKRSHLGISARTPVLVVPIPSLERFLAIAPHFTETIFSEWLPNPGFFQMAIFLAN